MSGIHLHIIAEGQTEQKFVLKVLAPHLAQHQCCLLYTSPSPRDRTRSRMPSSA